MPLFDYSKVRVAMTMPRLHYVGWSADFCRICRTPRAFIVYELRGGNRLIWAFHRVPRQEGDRIIVCEACGVYWSERHQRRVCVVDPPETYEELVQRTNPTLAEVHADRLNIEERVVRRRLSPGERAALLEEPLRLVEGMGAIDLLTYLRGFWFWTVAGFVFVAAVLLVARIKNWDHELVFLAGGLPLLAFLWTLRRIQFR